MAVISNSTVRAQREHNRHVRKAVAAPVIGRLFFPSEHHMLSLAAVYASFGVTLLMRPLGSALFGAFADTHGRKRAMIMAMVGVGGRATAAPARA